MGHELNVRGSRGQIDVSDAVFGPNASTSLVLIPLGLAAATVEKSLFMPDWYTGKWIGMKEMQGVMLGRVRLLR